MQIKLFRDAFETAGLDVKTDMVPLDIREMTTDEAVDKVTEGASRDGGGARWLTIRSWA